MRALQKIDSDEKSTRDVRGRKILATARADLVGHVAREERVAAALKTARANINKLDPKAAAARQYRVKRILTAARDTLTRVDRIKPSPEIVHRTTENARIASEAPSLSRRPNAAAIPFAAAAHLRHRQGACAPALH